MKEKVFYGLSLEGFYPTVYYEWGYPSELKDNTLLCVHGMARTGRDFDYLAQALSAQYRVVCPDLVGRGKSHRFQQRASYSVRQYLADLASLIARLEVSSLDWFGTSMGGILGMAVAAQPQTPVRRLILNDVGPQIPPEAINRLVQYIGIKSHFPTRQQGEEFLRLVYAPFGITREEHWQHLFRHTVVEDKKGGYTLNYDPNIVGATEEKNQPQEDLWTFWDKISCPVLVIHGEDSDILTKETLALMGQRGPQFDLVTVPRCGHVPMLFEESQINQVQEWLEKTAPQIKRENSF